MPSDRPPGKPGKPGQPPGPTPAGKPGAPRPAGPTQPRGDRVPAPGAAPRPASDDRPTVRNFPKPAAPKPVQGKPPVGKPPAPRPPAPRPVPRDDADDATEREERADAPPPKQPEKRPAPAGGSRPGEKKARPRPEDTLYPELRKEAWFRKLIVYPVINELEMNLAGDYLFESPAFMKILGNRRFRETCLSDAAFKDVLLSDEFRAFLEQFQKGRLVNFFVRSLGALLAIAVLAGCLYLAFFVPLAEQLPFLVPTLEKMKIAYDAKGTTLNPVVPQATLVVLGILLGCMAGGLCDWGLRRRYGPCSSCGRFGFGRKFPPRFCKGCGEWIEYLS
ncbi:MAG: hypothetical protein HYZ53_09905 [Planctomycetes bacterium]|nr:hypothetical protein [Planctomycetota bacterium]